ncbi:MAG: glyoxalase [Salibacteraceae bacterium]
MIREEAITALRPRLDLTKATNEVEQFQNTVLRPILKVQNELMIELAKDYVHRTFKSFNALKVSVQKQLIVQASKRNHKIRSMLIYTGIGLLTREELSLYLQHRAEFNKRIISMGTERVISQIDLLF